MLQINGKTFMNLQEAVQWLLDNNALPFQSSANYIANTEIGMGTIVNPSPAKVRIGSLIFFADSKVSTVIGLTENGFICSDQYNNLVDDIAYVTGVAINASGHLITTLSDGQTIDAGIIKQVSSFSINASQHLIVSYNDGTTTDLGAIFSGNITVSGNLTATGGISGNAITGNTISGGAVTGDSIIENMSGYSAQLDSNSSYDYENVYTGVVKNGNKVTIVSALNITKKATVTTSVPVLFVIVPTAVFNKLYPTTIGGYNSLAFLEVNFVASNNAFEKVRVLVQKGTSVISFSIYGGDAPNLTLNEKYYARMEITFLTSDGLI